jgi:RNA polymerase sigma factor (sigma-70 family)
LKPGRYDHITDEQLLSNYKADNNQEWIGILLERYTLLLFGVCMKYLKDEDEAKDGVQQVFLKVLTDVSKYEITYFKSWLYMVAKNYCLMRLRNTQYKQVQTLTEAIDNEPNEDRKSELIENEKTYTLLEQAIEELNEEQKQCVTLFYLKKYSYNQIVEYTNYNLSQVKSYIQNGKRNLKIILEKKLNESQSAKR